MCTVGEDCEFILEYLTGIPIEKLSEGKELLNKHVHLATKINSNTINKGEY